MNIDKCQPLAKRLQKEQLGRIQELITKHFPALPGDRLVKRVVKAIETGDGLTLLKEVRKVIRQPLFAKRLAALLDDLIVLAQDRRNLDALLTCYLANGSLELTGLLREMFGLLADISRVFTSKPIARKLDRLQKLSLAHFAYAEKFMRRKQLRV